MSDRDQRRDLIGADGLAKELTKALVERMLAGEMTIELPRDRNGTF